MKIMRKGRNLMQILKKASECGNFGSGFCCVNDNTGYCCNK